jgi:hypothetical protein
VITRVPATYRVGVTHDHRFAHLRQASKQDWFPYKGIGPRSYYTVTPDGVLNQLHAVGELREAIKRAKHGEVALLAVWTGQYNSDLFFIDDLDAIESAGI